MKECEAACGTAEQAEKLKAVIEESRSTPGCLMHILQEAQGIYGYLPIEVQTFIAEGMGVSLSEVYGVASFYAQFTADRYTVTWDLKTAAHTKNGNKYVYTLSYTITLNTDESGFESGKTYPANKTTTLTYAVVENGSQVKTGTGHFRIPADEGPAAGSYAVVI